MAAKQPGEGVASAAELAIWAAANAIPAPILGIDSGRPADNLIRESAQRCRTFTVALLELIAEKGEQISSVFVTFTLARPVRQFGLAVRKSNQGTRRLPGHRRGE
jgi:hypothetical protein